MHNLEGGMVLQEQEFDELTKKLASPVPRRTVLRVAVITALGGLFGLGKARETEAAFSKGCVTDTCGGICCPSGEYCRQSDRTCQCSTFICGAIDMNGNPVP